MSKFSCRVEKSKTTKETVARERHNRRKGNCKSSEKDKEHLNEYKGVEGISKYVQALEERINADLKAQGKKITRKDAVKLIEVICTSDSEFFEKTDTKTFFHDCDNFLEEFWGKDNVIGEYLHLDEGTPHKHYFITPVKDNKFNYSAFIDGRNELSAFQGKGYDYMLERGYDFEERELASVSKKKHQKTRDWAKSVSKAESMVALMDEQKKTDYAVKGILAEQDHKALYERLESVTEENKELRKAHSELFLENAELEEKYNGVHTMLMDTYSNNVDQVEKFEKTGIHLYKTRKQYEEQQALKESKEKESSKDDELEM